VSRNGGSNGAGQQRAANGTGIRNGGSNGVAQPRVETVAGLRNGGSNGNGQPKAEIVAELRNGGSNGNGTAAPTIQATPTTYWLKANDYAGKLDRAAVSALAKQVMDGKMSWQEAQSRLDDMIDAATLPSFGAGNGVGVKVPVAVSAKPMAERARNPLDELFA
jgi:hypothetical protein